MEAPLHCDSPCLDFCIYTTQPYLPIIIYEYNFFMRHFQRKIKSSPNEKNWNEVDFSLNGVDMIELNIES